MNLQNQSHFPEVPIQKSVGRALSFLLAFYFGSFFFFALIAPGLPAFFHAPQFDGSFASLILPILTAWFGAALAIGLVFLVSRNYNAKQIHNRELLALLGGGMAADLAFNFAALKLASGAEHASAAWVLIATANLGVLAAAIALGLLVARGLKRPSYLLTAAIVGALTDIFSVYAGPSKQVLSSDFFPYVSFQWGVAGQGVIPCVGAGDFIFLCLFFAGVRRFGLDDRKTLRAMIAAFGLGFLSIFVSPQGIPALPFMAVLLLIAHGFELKQLQTAPQ